MVMKNQKGQTVVEYILLMMVAVSLFMTFYRSNAFQRMFGENGSLGVGIKKQNEHAYRHAFIRGWKDETPNPGGSAATHQSYYNSDKGETRFFGPIDKYP